MPRWLNKAGFLLAREVLWLKALWRFMALGHTDPDGVVWLLVHRRWRDLDKLVGIDVHDD